MSFLLDTNVVSEWVKPRPDPGVVDWLSQVDESTVFLSAITVMELRFGVDRLPSGARKTRLDQWLSEQLPQRFETRILAVDASVANICGMLLARGKTTGRSMATMDAFIAATAMVHGLKLVTRNVADFKSVLGAALLINPWL